MEIIIYVDFLFGLSFLYNFILFWLLGIIFYRSFRPLRTVGAALCGAAMDILSPLTELALGELIMRLQIILILPVLSIFFKERNLKRLFSIGVSYVFLSAFLAGLCELIFFSKAGGLAEIIAALPAGAIFLWTMCTERKKYKLKSPFIYRVRLKTAEKTVEAIGFYDTGNGLFVPNTIKPVILLEAELYKELFGHSEGKIEIPYSAVGTSRGVLDGDELDLVYIEAEGGILAKGVVAARALGTLSPEGYYKVILHPQLFAER